MNTTQVVVEGTLKPDGSLKVAEKLGLPPGRVRLTIEVLGEPDSSVEDWLEYLKGARAELESTLAGLRTGEAIDAEINAMRDEWDRS